MQKARIVGKAWARLRRFEVCVALSGRTAFAVVGPLRGAFAALPEVPLMGTLILFMVPGVLLTRWLLDDYFSGAAALPAAFVISAGAFALLGAPMLLLQSTLETYLWAAGAAVAAFLLAAASFSSACCFSPPSCATFPRSPRSWGTN